MTELADTTSRAREATPSANAPEPAAEWIDRSTLKPWDRNPRKNAAAVAKIAASIKRFGFGSPILARRADREVIAGHTRLLAAESLGIDRVPVRFLDLDPADAHLLALADNKLGEIADWDSLGVAEVLSDYGLDDAEMAGWDKDELDKLGGVLDSELGAAEDQTDKTNVGFVVLVECANEEEQLRTIDDLIQRGYKCRALT